MNLTAKAIIDKFGGQTALARSLGKPSSTVHEWASKGIPAKWQKVLLTKAREENIDLTAEDFFVEYEEKKEKSITKIPKATHSGDLQIGNITLPAYVLSDGQRVFSSSAITRKFFEVSTGDLKDYLNAQKLKPFIINNLNKPDNATIEKDKSFITNEFHLAETQVIDSLIKFDTGLKGIAQYGLGLPVEKLIDLCIAYSTLGDTDEFTLQQKMIAKKANKFIAASAKIGIIALVDEATGYQYDREENALQIKLKLFLADSMREWDKTFPDDLWVEFAKLTGWKGNPKTGRPQWWGKLVNELIYGYLDKDVLDWLKVNAPKPMHGQNYHQWMSSQYGLNKLIQHIWQTIGMARSCENMDELRRLMAHKFGGEHFQMSFWMRM